MSEPRSTVLNVNINSETAAALKTLADKYQISITEAVRRSVAMWKFVEDEIAAGNQVRIVRTDGRTSRLEPLP